LTLNSAADPRAVLVVTHRTDDHAPLVRAELENLGIEVIWFDTDEYGHTADLTFSIVDGVAGVTFRANGSEYRGDSVAAVLFRHIRLPQTPGVADPGARRMAESELRATLEGGLLALEPALWVNHPHANRLARSKLLQLRLASRLGFSVPETRVSADPVEIRTLFSMWNGRMVAKLAGGQIAADSIDSQFVVYTTAITAEDLQDADALSACPALYQRHVDKRYDLRVTMIGERVFACRIHSQEIEDARVDWRAADPSSVHHERCELDPLIANSCRSLMTALGLEIAGIDFIVTPKGETVFLEINAAGQWLWIEKNTGLPIAAALAQHLATATRRPF
jgi:glutathione synthase/RimK-type ligase-like ATP-grasp enzyme